MPSGTYPQGYGTYPQMDGVIIDTKGNAIYGQPLIHVYPVDFIGGSTDVSVVAISAGVVNYDRIYSKMSVCLDTAPGVGKSVTATLTTDGTSEAVTVSDTDTCGCACDLDLLWDSANDDVTLTYTETAGGATEHGSIILEYRLVK